MKTGSALRVAVVALTSLAVVGQHPASADKLKVEESYGTAFRTPSVLAASQILSNCGDADPATNVILQTNTGTVTYTGIIEGTGAVSTTSLINNCVSGFGHNTFRVLDTFESVTVAGRTGGAVVEILGRGSNPAPGVALNDNTIRILCGTGELKGIHPEGTLTASIGPGVASRALQLWVHFGHRHDVGFDFLCRGLPLHDSDD